MPCRGPWASILHLPSSHQECKEVKLFVHKGENSWELTTFLRDDHALVTSVIPNSPGVYTLKAYQGDRLLASDEFGVDGE
jgi:hypothetical protein